MAHSQQDFMPKNLAGYKKKKRAETDGMLKDIDEQND